MEQGQEDAPAPPDPLVSATLASAAGAVGPGSRPAALAAATLKARSRRLGLLAVLILAAGLLAAAAWGARAATAAHPAPQSPPPPAADPVPSPDAVPPAQPHACHPSDS